MRQRERSEGEGELEQGTAKRRPPHREARANPAVDTADGLLDLQRAVGNRAVHRLVTGAVVQPKLEVGPAGDQFEREADQVADEVMRSLSAGTVEADEPRVRRSITDDVVGLEGGPLAAEAEGAIQGERGRGTALPDELRTSMEHSFGADFSGVRVHADASADALSRSMQARAFTVGSDIFFAKGQYQPTTTAGQRVLAHELTHTVQQGAAGSTTTAAREAIQRLLDVQNPLQAGDVATVTRLDAKVWLLDGNQGDSLVVKVELPQPGEGEAGFGARHSVVTGLAQATLTGVPGSKVLGAPEVAELANLPPEADPQHHGGPGFTLHDIVTTPGPPMVFLKVAKVQMGRNLESRIAAHQNVQGGGWGAGVSPRGIVTNPAVLKELGKTAAFDLLVNNADRFRPDGTGYPTGVVNLKNIDFNQQSKPIAIDNLDPNNRIYSDDEAQNLGIVAWEGMKRLANKGSRSGYATEAVRAIMGAVGGVTLDIPTLKPHIKAFRDGMETAVATLIQLRGQFIGFLGLGDRRKQKIANVLIARIDQIQP